MKIVLIIFLQIGFLNRWLIMRDYPKSEIKKSIEFVAPLFPTKKSNSSSSDHLKNEEKQALQDYEGEKKFNYQKLIRKHISHDII